MSSRHPLRTVALLAGAIAAVGPAIAQAHQPRSSVTTGSSTPATRAILTAQGVGAVHFGESSTTAITALDKLLGIRLTARPAAFGCGVSRTATAHGLTLFLGSGKLIGYQVSAGTGLSSTRGLAVGDSVSQARSLYGSAFVTTLAQGGDWHVGRGTAKLSGYLHGTPPITPASTIGTIDAGVVGCAAAQP